MKLSIHSDLHLEFEQNRAWLPKIPDCADAIALIGDIHVGDGLIEAIRRLSELYTDKLILCVVGNHEFYRSDYQGLLDRYRVQFDALPNCHLLENDTYEWRGVRFLGCTLWTNFSALEPKIDTSDSLLMCQRSISDFFLIENHGERLSGAGMVQLNEQSVSWLNEELSTNFDGKTIVLTHFPPLVQLRHPKFPADQISAYFLNNLEQLVHAHDINCWAFGHNHWNDDIWLHGCRFVSNQRGYPGENDALQGYDEAKIIEILAEP